MNRSDWVSQGLPSCCWWMEFFSTMGHKRQVQMLHQLPALSSYTHLSSNLTSHQIYRCVCCSTSCNLLSQMIFSVRWSFFGIHCNPNGSVISWLEEHGAWNFDVVASTRQNELGSKIYLLRSFLVFRYIVIAFVRSFGSTRIECEKLIFPSIFSILSTLSVHHAVASSFSICVVIRHDKNAKETRIGHFHCAILKYNADVKP